MPESDAESCDQDILRDIRIAEKQLDRGEGLPHEEVERRMLERFEEWAKEADRRYRQLKAGQAESIASVEVFREARTRLVASSSADLRSDD